MGPFGARFYNLRGVGPLGARFYILRRTILAGAGASSRGLRGALSNSFLALTNLFSYPPRGLPKGSATRTKLTPGASPEYGQKAIKPKNNKLLEHA